MANDVPSVLEITNRELGEPRIRFLFASLIPQTTLYAVLSNPVRNPPHSYTTSPVVSNAFGPPEFVIKFAVATKLVLQQLSKVPEIFFIPSVVVKNKLPFDSTDLIRIPVSRGTKREDN